MKRYEGIRTATGGLVIVIDTGESGSVSYLPLRFDLYNHQPYAFGWGHIGTECVHLAFAILADFRGDKFAVQYHQPFKNEFVEKMDRPSWILEEQDLLKILNKIMGVKMPPAASIEP